MSRERYSTVRSTLEKKLEWGGALVNYLQEQEQNAYFQNYHPHPIQPQNALQGQLAYNHGGVQMQADAVPMFHPNPRPTFPNPNPSIFHVSSSIEHAGISTNTATVPMRRPDTVTPNIPLLHLNNPKLLPQHSLAPHTPTANNVHKAASVLATQALRRGDSASLDIAEKSNLPMVTSVKNSSRRTRSSTAASLFTVRPTGTKDRHSKVRTAKGLRDRRVRLSAPTAIQFFDVQDRLGYDQPSKAVDWLIKKARAAIDELAPVEGVTMGEASADQTLAPITQKVSRDDHTSSVQVKDEEQQRSSGNGAIITAAASGTRIESRAKARERARERAKEKSTTSSAAPAALAATSTSPIPASSAPSPTPPTPQFPSSPPNLHLLPEFLLLTSQFRQALDDSHRPSDLASILSPPSGAISAPSHLLPLPSHFFPPLPTSAYPGDMLPLQFSAPPISYNNNTSISPRGTLQSIFSNPASSMPSHGPIPPFMMMGALHAHAFGASLGPASGCVAREGGDDHGKFQHTSAELGSPDLQQHFHIPMHIRGMELDANEESRITPTSSMQADFQ